MAKTSNWVSMPLTLDWELDNRNPAFTGLFYSNTAQAAEDFSFGSAPPRQRLVNYLPEKSGDKVWLRQRDLLTTAGAFFDKGGAVTNPRGIFWANSIDRLIELWNTTMYVWSATDTYTTVSSMGNATDGPGGFAEGIDSSGVAYVFASTVTKSVIVKTSGNTQVTDADFPTSIVPMPVFMDSYIFVAAFNSRKIYNCNVGDPTSFQASTYIETEEYAGNIVGLARQKKFVVSLNENSIEFFRDAGIPSPNSPLQRVPELSKNVGCINRATIAVHNESIYFVGKDASGEIGVYRIGPSGELELIGTPSVNYLMQLHANDSGDVGVIGTWTTSVTSSTRAARAYMIPFQGKWYYGLHCNWGTAPVSGSAITAPISLVYNPELKLWIEIAASHFSTTPGQGAGGWPFPFGTLMLSSLGGTYDRFLMQNAYGGTTDTDLAKLGQSAEYEIANTSGGYQTATSIAKNIIQWPLMDFDTPALKDLSGIAISAIGGSASGGLFAATGAVQPSFIHYGQYLTNGTAGSPIFTAYDLSPQNIVPPQGELVHVHRTPLICFRQQWTQLLLSMLSDTGISSVWYRIGAHEEP